MVSISLEENRLFKELNNIIYDIFLDERKDGLDLIKKYISHLFCPTYFYTKKGLLNQLILNVNALHEKSNCFNKSKMVVFRVNRNNKKAILDGLFNLCRSCGHHRPIVQVGERNIYFFPKLNYGDAYLLKDMFQNKFVNQEINVFISGLVI